ncbi:MAG: class I SAM-dependent rRNA methyltransferase [Chlamydiae bacterium]|nr:class I SAM-dependent rRNA methyltransferase [Chlamydiota bacterium]MBI3278067.1 class I SAM-dependent rRNA methyltransferase [Chlamydiota bacterium]
MKTVTLYSKGIDRVLRGHPWIYRSQIKGMSPGIQPGDAVFVISDRKKKIGTGFINPKSEITLRLLTHHEESIDLPFFKKRIEDAISWRKRHIEGTNAIRWINSESDQLPGLILDEYAGHFVLQISTLALELQKPLLIQLIKDLFSPKSLYERNDFPSRQWEGLPLLQGTLQGETPPLVEIEENKIRFWVNISQGHKTGFYLDQRENRKALRGYTKGKEVLDCFSYTGGFAVASLVQEAKSVLAFEISEEALALGQENAKLNGVQDRWQGQLGNAFDLLKSSSLEDKKFDLIILDPPSFTKSKAHLERALRGYKEINLRALKMLREGGILVSACCSHHVDEKTFQQTILNAAQDAHRMLYQINQGTQAIDHPIVLSIPETKYLKCFFFEVFSSS